jgi:ribose transport system substrate-binding protein
MKYISLVMVCLLLSVSVLTAQENTSENVECPLEDGVLNLAWIPKSLDNSVFSLGRIAAEIAVEELNETSPCQVDLLVVAPLNTDADEQVQLLNELIEMGTLDGIAVSCIGGDSCVQPINAAIEAGIPTMTWDSDAPDSDRFTYLGIDNYEGGQAAAELLLRSMGEEGRVGILTGAESSTNLNARIEGFLDVVSEYDGIEIVEIVYTTESAVETVGGIERVMAENPDVNGWFFAGLWPLTMGRGAMPLWEAATLNGDLYTVVFDTLPFQLEFLTEGYLVGLIGQKYWGWGYDSIYMLHDHIINCAEFESFTNSGMDIVTAHNAEAMMEAWENTDFSQPLPPAFPDDESEDDENQDGA